MIKPPIVEAKLMWNAKGTIIVTLWKYGNLSRYLDFDKHPSPDLQKEVRNLDEAMEYIRDNQ